MRWRKLGHVYAPSGEHWWARSYATIPTAEVLDDNTIRIYFASLDQNKFGRIGYIEVDAKNPLRILYETQEPVLGLGALGAFDDSGVNPSCVLSAGEQKFLYYIGWQRAFRVPYMLFAGLAIVDAQSMTHTRYSRVPILDRTNDEPFSRSAPFVRKSHGIYQLWYWSCIGWTENQGSIHYNNVIKYLESTDGIHWSDSGLDCITPDFDLDYSVGRPWVVLDNTTYKMWYSIRSHSPHLPYRIGYAESTDGKNWRQKSETVGIGVSPQGWDSEMICYPCIVDTLGTRYMFYNGNRHGMTGFGCAVLESD